MTDNTLYTVNANNQCTVTVSDTAVLKFSYMLQLKVLTMPENARYTPLKDISNGGIILMKDVKPGEKEEIVEPVAGML